MKRSLFMEIISFLYILLFVYAALMKLMDVEKFTVQMGQSPLLMAFAPVLAWVVPISEIAIALLIAIPKSRLIGMYAAFTLMIMFTTYIFIILNYADHVPCSCGGILEDMGWTEHLIFNIAFVVIAIVGVWLEGQTSEASQKETLIQT